MAYSKTRRALLRSGLSVVGAQITSSLSIGRAAAPGRRSVVCIYLLGGNNSASILTPGGTGNSPDFHPALQEIRELYGAGVLAAAANIGDATDGLDAWSRRMDPALAYLPQGYLTLNWAGGFGASGLKNAFTQFRNDIPGSSRANTSLVVPDGISADELARQVGTAISRDTVRQDFPATPLGRQLRQVAQVLASGLTGGIFVCPMSAAAVFDDPEGRETARLRELSGAMAAFHAATLSLGVANSVTTFTASELHLGSGAQGAKRAPLLTGGYELAMGGGVAGGNIFGAADASSPAVSRERYMATVANWFGVPRAELKNHFPRLSSIAAPTLDFLI